VSLLSHNELVELVEQGIITNVKPEQINSTSIDVTLGEKILFEGVPSTELRNVVLKERTPLTMQEWLLSWGPFTLTRQMFILAETEQVFNLPSHISAEYKLKSSMARIGLEHMNAGWCDAGWHGSKLTLELKNLTQFHSIVLHKGDRIGQVVFFRHRPVDYDKSYAARGRYNKMPYVSGPVQKDSQ
jgi:deoxycytidine triphosphate deaminase